MTPATYEQFDDIVLGGVYAHNGMAPFNDLLSKDDAEEIKAYILQQAHLAWDEKHPQKKAEAALAK